ncbi:hypothetical protein BC938DRAFT_472169 [Jimgerdemannia flammicorona]|uniref:Uncharacterized protein n=1 Tax=Jimgerdemannia flammicorona TaxID=994334 RepID=A0A433QU74_9FUNG|nr:hypothetical protein BC938DRAFT_472169 [Jimgerdemannia flammicorona]
MPPLRSIAADLDPLLAFHKDTIAQLDAIGIKSDKSLLLADDNYITSNTKLSLQTIRAFRDDVINECKAAPVRADDLFLELEQKERCLSTGCNR